MTLEMLQRHAAEAARALAAARALPLCGGVAAYLLGALAIGARLSAAARALDARVRTLLAAAIAQSAVLASHVSFGAAAGEAARIGWLARALRGRPGATQQALAIVAVDRVADAIAIAAVLGLGALAGAPRTGHALGPLLLGALAVTVVGALLLRGRVPLARLGRGAIGAVPPAVAAWALDLLRVYLVARAVGLPLGPTALAALALAALVGGQAPTPGGIGAVEAAMIAAGAALGLPPGPLAAAVVLDRLVTLGLGTALGAISTTALASSARRTA